MRSLRSSLAVLFAICALAAVSGNGASRPLEAHEVFVARTATEIGRSGQWLVPSFNAAPRLEKPPLAYWSALAVHGSLGRGGSDVVTELEARLPAALAALLLVWVTYALAVHTWGDRRAALAAAVMWGTSAGFHAWAHNARPEMLYALWCSLALLGFVRLATGVGRGSVNALGAWLAIALALITKGPFLPAFIVVGVVLALALQRRSDARSPGIAATLRPWLGVVLVVTLAGGYFALVAYRVPGALEFWRSQMFDRTGGVGGASFAFLTLPWLWNALPLLAPWLMPIPFAAALAWRSPRVAVRMLACSVAVALLCLSFAPRSHGYYALPVLPAACALLGGAAIDLLERWSARAPRRGVVVLKLHAAAAALTGIAIAVLALRNVDVATVPARACAVVACAAGLVAAAYALRAARRSPQHAFVLVATSFALAFAASALSNVGWEAERYTKAAFAKELPPGVPLARVGGSLELVVYYADRHVDDVAPSQLEAWLAAHPDGLVVARERDLVEGRVRGRTLVTEPLPPGSNPMVLVDPRVQ